MPLFIFKGVVKSQVDIKIQFFKHLHMKGLVSFPCLLVIAIPTPSSGKLVYYCQAQFTKTFNGDVILGARNTARSAGPLIAIVVHRPVGQKFGPRMSKKGPHSPCQSMVDGYCHCGDLFRTRGMQALFNMIVDRNIHAYGLFVFTNSSSIFLGEI